MSEVFNGCILGDSTICAGYGCFGVDYYVLSAKDIAAGYTTTNLAQGSHTILNQKAAWLADPNKSTYDWVVVEIGLNDLNPAEAASVALVRYQDLVDTILSGIKWSARVVTATMTPCKADLINIYGAGPGAVAYTKWLDMNEAISGAGALAIVGMMASVSEHTDALNDGAGNLDPLYDLGDGIHENDAAREIIATKWRIALFNIGCFPDERPYPWKGSFQ